MDCAVRPGLADSAMLVAHITAKVKCDSKCFVGLFIFSYDCSFLGRSAGSSVVVATLLSGLVLLVDCSHCCHEDDITAGGRSQRCACSRCSGDFLR